jgi:hypothetical protein
MSLLNDFQLKWFTNLYNLDKQDQFLGPILTNGTNPYYIFIYIHDVEFIHLQ